MKNLIVFCCFIVVASAQWDNWPPQQPEWQPPQQPEWQPPRLPEWQPPRQPPRQEVIVEHLPNGRTRCRLACNRPLWDCPIVDCPLPDRPVLNRQCPVTVCNEQNLHVLFPTPDPNFFYQCRRTGMTTFETLVRPCGCMTYFDYNQQLCVHPAQFEVQCNATPIPYPPPTACIPECPGCDGGSPPVQIPPATPSPPVNIPPGNNPPGNNPPGCPCMPCVWWPCSPCNC